MSEPREQLHADGGDDVDAADEVKSISGLTEDGVLSPRPLQPFADGEEPGTPRADELHGLGDEDDAGGEVEEARNVEPAQPRLPRLQIEQEEGIIEQVQKAYRDPEHGLLAMASLLGRKLVPPHERAMVLIIGNHSAGKSSFINWYIGETIQKESVAMETSGFTFVTHGRRRDTFRGAATLKHFPYLQGIEVHDGLLSNLSTEVCTSRKRQFPLVDFVDTPGLTDGNLKYPFKINDVSAGAERRRAAQAHRERRLCCG
jgi:hypothetical protein